MIIIKNKQSNKNKVNLQIRIRKIEKETEIERIFVKWSESVKS